MAEGRPGTNSEYELLENHRAQKKEVAEKAKSKSWFDWFKKPSNIVLLIGALGTGGIASIISCGRTVAIAVIQPGIDQTVLTKDSITLRRALFRANQHTDSATKMISDSLQKYFDDLAVKLESVAAIKAAIRAQNNGETDPEEQRRQAHQDFYGN